MSRKPHLKARLLWTTCVLAATSLAHAHPQVAFDRSGAELRQPRPDPAPRDVLDFERELPSAVLDQTLSLLGEGPVLVRGRRSGLADLNANAALVFDSTRPGEATDLGTPGEAFGGDGVGDDGHPGSPYENRARLGNVLTVAQDLVDLDGDGRIDRPADADGVEDAVLDLDFSGVGPVVLHSLTLIDVKSPTAAVVLYAENGAPLTALALPAVGDNGTTVVDLGGMRGVYSMRVRLDGSGAIDDVVFSKDRAGRIASSVWFDRNGDGLRGPEDPGLGGVKVELGDAFGQLLDVTTTRHDGRFVFKHLVAGPYIVRVDESSLPARFFPTVVDAGFDDALDSDANPATVVLLTNDDLAEGTSFGFVSDCSGAIGDYVWHDLDEDGIQDEGEPGMQGITLRLYTVIFKGDGQFKGELIEELSTGLDGFYAFLGLCPGVYFVEVAESSLPPFFSPTLCDVGPDGTDSECSPEPVLVRTEIWTTRSIDFGYVSEFNGSIGDFVWMDDNCDGFQDLELGLEVDGERGLVGARVILNDDMGVVVAETTTETEGQYEFLGLAAGNYSVSVDDDTIMDGFVESPCNPGLSDETDNDCSGVEVQLSATGESSGSAVEMTVIYDFGFRPQPCNGNGCSRVNWKQFPDIWPVPYTDDQPFDDVFVRGYPGLTLGDVLELDADRLNAVARQAVAALLNAASPLVDFPLTVEEVIALYAEAEALRGTPGEVLLPEKGRYLQFLNEQICPFGT